MLKNHYSEMLFNRLRRSGLLIPATNTRFFEDVAPDWILSIVEGTSSLSDNNEMIAWFAFPPIAGPYCYFRQINNIFKNQLIV
jgi:hypothetical protein